MVQFRPTLNRLYSVPRPAVTIWGTGTPRREFLYSDDLADACLFLMERYNAAGIGEFINIGMGEDISIRELAELAARVVGFDGNLVFDAGKPDGTPRKLLDVSRLHALGWRHKTELEEGIKKTYHVVSGERQVSATMEALKPVFERYGGKVVFAYLFGSVARGDISPISDVDVAVYLDDNLADDFFDIKLSMYADICRALKRNEVDLIVLNNVPVVLKHQIISDGIVLKENHPRRIIFETEALREYLDTRYLRDVQFQYMREKIRRGVYFG